MTSTKQIIAFAALAACLSCGSATTETAAQPAATFHSPEIGWTMRLPAGWDVMSESEVGQLTGVGLNAFEDANGVEVDASGLKPLVGFRQDAFNNFLSTIEKLDASDVENYTAFQATLKAMLYGTFAAQGIRADTSSTAETVQGLDFDVFNTTIHAPDGAVIIRQAMYSRLINGYDFGATLSYNNEAARDTMLAAWRGSAFTR